MDFPWDSPGQTTGVGCRSFLQGIFPTQESNAGLQHCRQILYCLCPEKPCLQQRLCQMLSGQNPHSSWSFCDFPSIDPHFASLSVNPSCPYSVVDSGLPPHCKFSLNKIIHVAFNRCQNNLSLELLLGFLDGSVGKESSCNAGDPGSVPGSGRSPEEGIGYPLLYSGLENCMDCTVHGVAKSWTRLSDFHLELLLFQNDNGLQNFYRFSYRTEHTHSCLNL